ncbi:Endonuclease III [Candidatus Arsenophonus lipoptenae]|uniref:Endonuclease III n=1 Tax=Candidatus Arsenophonus lipoptenae TaxID=634113 RepID=A0A0X9VDK6_9GAMM|nr:endonuclease III [Candidatus Arsenophonus lipoptenae]AMA64644.1 Endonuclease III [Candidatus Arsenophonus lipoptenae]
MDAQNRIAILNRLHDKNPTPKIELIFNSSFELLISVLLSAQTTDKSVNKATAKLYQVANTAEKMLNLGLDKIKNHIKTIGLSNTKAKNIIKICQILIDKYNGKVPENREFLESLPGIGRKTANVVLNIAFGWPTIAVDTHVFRVCNRTNFVTGKNVIEVEQKLIEIVPIKFKFNFNLWFVLHGRYTCTARKPFCNICIIENLCEFNNKHNHKVC